MDDDKEIVSALCAALAQRLTEQRFTLWFTSQARLTLRDGRLVVQSQNAFAQEWIRSHYRGDIEAACVEAVGKPLAIEFEVEPALARSPGARPEKEPAAKRTSSNGQGQAHDVVAVASHGDGSPRLLPLVAKTAESACATAPAPRPYAKRKFHSLESFVVGSSNKIAHATATLVAEQPGRYSPLFVHGPTGVGKTHLLEGIWCAARVRCPELQAVYLSAEQFTTQFVEALNGAGLPSFRRKYRSVELLIIDDVQFFEGKRATLTELIHTVDAIIREGRQLILAGDRCPAELRALHPELAARLGGGMVCQIDSPDYQTRLGIVRRLSAKIGLTLADDVAELLATHLTSHARELAGAINRLDAASRILQQPITRAIAEEALGEMIRHSTRPLKLKDIDKAVCDVFGLAEEDLHSTRRAKSISGARMLAMYLARKHTHAPLVEIGAHFGRRSHSTVFSADKQVRGLVAQQGKIDLRGKPCQVEDAIRHIEAQLRQA